jgi:glycosyltransferase involved in cell wall biosynthesis
LYDTIGFEREDRGALWRSLPGGRFGLIANRLDHWIARKRADHVITLSEYSSRQLQKLFGLQPENISVVYAAADPRFHQPVTDVDRAKGRRIYGIAGRYFFYVGGWEERKNVQFLVRAFAATQLRDVNLLLAGGQHEQRANLIALASELGVSHQVKLLEWVDDPDLPALYAEAVAFVYPSRREGFGLQLCEAMAVGCPVLAARTTSLPEVLGNGGELFGVETVTELVSLLRQVAGNADFRAGMILRGSARSEYFSWQRTAAMTLDVYRKLIR